MTAGAFYTCNGPVTLLRLGRLYGESTCKWEGASKLDGGDVSGVRYIVRDRVEHLYFGCGIRMGQQSSQTHCDMGQKVCDDSRRAVMCGGERDVLESSRSCRVEQAR